RLFDVLVAPATGERIALQHLEQEPGTAARRMLFLARHPVARAHRRAFVPPAFADADAADGGEREAVTVLRKGEVGFRIAGTIGRAEPQVVVNPVRADDFARVA